MSATNSSVARSGAPARGIRTRHPALDRLAGMADSTFDIVSKVDRMEAENAVNQARKEVEQRYDFKNVGASVEWSGEKVLLKGKDLDVALQFVNFR